MHLPLCGVGAEVIKPYNKDGQYKGESRQIALLLHLYSKYLFGLSLCYQLLNNTVIWWFEQLTLTLVSALSTHVFEG